MDNLLVTLAAGLGAGAAAFVLLYRLTHLRSKQIGLMVAAATLLLYLPWGIARWPGADVFALHVALFLLLPYGLGLVSSQWDRRPGHSGGAGPGFHWAPATIVGFFAVIAVVDAVIISLSKEGLPAGWAGWVLPEPRGGGEVRSHFPGTVPHDFQEKEAQYNAHMRQLERQRERGWQVVKGWREQPVVGEPARLKLAVTERSGDPVRSARVQGRFLRPANTALDQAFTMAERKPGVYTTELTMPAPGTWQVVITIRRGEAVHELRGRTEVLAAQAG